MTSVDDAVSAGGTPDPAPPAELADAAKALFGERLDLAVEYAGILATDGVTRGLIGPREVSRIWDRHLLNCAVVAELVPSEAAVLDVGSGAGLPGVVLALARPDLTVTLIEPMARRVAFLTEVVERLGLGHSVSVVRARAEEPAARDLPPAPVVTARALAPLDRLARWCLPLTAPGGRILALKGATAGEEVAEHGVLIERLGGSTPVIRHCGVGLVDPPTTVVEILRVRVVEVEKSPPKARRRAG
ncbi:MAG TPA: 16S rRNA (guanine(527)-N(7))-methyltransferase RsmG [Micromonosporaceae bacterium]